MSSDNYSTEGVLKDNKNVQQIRKHAVLTSADLTPEEIERGTEIADELVEKIINGGKPMPEECYAAGLIQIDDDQYVRLMTASRGDLALHRKWLKRRMQESSDQLVTLMLGDVS